MLFVMSYLQPFDLGRCRQVNKLWSNLAADPQLWRTLRPVSWAQGDIIQFIFTLRLSSSSSATSTFSTNSFLINIDKLYWVYCHDSLHSLLMSGDFFLVDPQLIFGQYVHNSILSGKFLEMCEEWFFNTFALCLHNLLYTSILSISQVMFENDRLSLFFPPNEVRSGVMALACPSVFRSVCRNFVSGAYL